MVVKVSHGLYGVFRGAIRDEETFVNVLYRATQFYVQVSHDEMKGTEVEAEYLSQVQKANAGEIFPLEAWNTLCDCVLSLCFPLLEELSPLIDSTIQDCYRTLTYNVKIIAVDGTLGPKSCLAQYIRQLTT